MLYYIGFYAQQQNLQNRHMILAAVNKMDYIIHTLKKSDVRQTIVSCCVTNDKKSYSGMSQKIDENIILKTFRTFGRKNILTKAADIFFIKFQMILYLLKNVKKNDILLAYHSPFYCRELQIIKAVKKCRLILEVEEIYADVSGIKKMRRKELDVCNSADSYIFPTRMLSDVVNPDNKPSVIIHGTYQVEPERKCNVFETDLQKGSARMIHCVYAGTFDPRKGGAIAAAAAAEHLPSNYHIHILGFGSKADTQNMKDIISKIAKKAKAKLTYDGLLSGEDYIRFIQSCDIGLSTQNPDAAFNATSFPSKILSYMANGLRVVSIRIPAIETSAIGDYMYYYDKQTPQEIAKAIKAVDFSKAYDGRKIIVDLDEQFIEDLKGVLNI